MILISLIIYEQLEIWLEMLIISARWCCSSFYEYCLELLILLTNWWLFFNSRLHHK